MEPRTLDVKRRGLFFALARLGSLCRDSSSLGNKQISAPYKTGDPRKGSQTLRRGTHYSHSGIDGCLSYFIWTQDDITPVLDLAYEQVRGM